MTSGTRLGSYEIVAYHATEQNSITVYVQPFPATGARHQLVSYIPRVGVLEVVSVTNS